MAIITPKQSRRTSSIRHKKPPVEHTPLKLSNSLTKRKEVFTSVEPGKVRMYTCGLTVNYLMHIGHARCYIFWDVVERFLRYLGYDVKHISNITDISVDDRILKRVRETGETFQQLVTRHTLDYIMDRRQLGIKDPLTYTLATQHIHQMIELIQRLLAKGYAYVAEDGVYFRISKFSKYGSLAGIDPKKLQIGASGRIDKDEYDKDAAGDFVLWKKANPDEPYWYSPWGKGRPGWHIECSAMSMTYLGETIDISGGGEDNIFPHHENSIAQSEAATGNPYVKYWLHVRHLMLEGKKMSKSTGHFLLARDAISKYGAAAVRLFLLSTHYRKPIDFNPSDLARSQKQLDRLQQVLTHLSTFDASQITSKHHDDQFIGEISEVETKIREALLDDFNTGLAVNTFFRFINKVAGRVIETTELNSQETKTLLTFFHRIGRVLFGDLFDQEVVITPDPVVTSLVEWLLQERTKLRTSRHFKEADAIRMVLQKLGVEISDTATGSTWWIRPYKKK